MILPPVETYAESRARLVALTAELGGTIEHREHPRPGPAGEPLTTDVARFGSAPGATRTVVLIGSGTHGVEGHAGWGLQQRLLESGVLRTLPAGVAVVILHAINPYGMAWTRRVDGDNIDVNRNFVDVDRLPANEHYGEIFDLLNPVELDLDDTSWFGEVAALQDRVGAAAMFRTVSGGQYDFPTGLQFGGQHHSWSRRTLEQIWRTHALGAETVINLDLHTGLGPCGALTIFQSADAADPGADAAARWFPSVFRTDRARDDGDALTQGLLGPGLEATLAAAGSSALVVPIVVEFGTLDLFAVSHAVRADNWLHHHGDHASAAAARIRRLTLDAFFVDDDPWRRSVAEQGAATIEAALDAARSVAVH